MKIIRAEYLGMCFGVKDAIALAFETAAGTPLTVLGDLVHNETVLGELKARGIRIEQDAAAVATPTVMITAHGASERKLADARGRGLKVLEATCPLVHVAHRTLAGLVRDGFHPVVIGKRDHVEVRGLTEDLGRFDVVLEDADVAALPPRPRLGSSPRRRSRSTRSAGWRSSSASGSRRRRSNSSTPSASRRNNGRTRRSPSRNSAASSSLSAAPTATIPGNW